MLQAMRDILGMAPAGLEFIEYIVMALLLGFMCYGLLKILSQIFSFIKM